MRHLCSVGDIPGLAGSAAAEVVSVAATPALSVVAALPAGGAVVPTSPTALSVTFSEPLQGWSLGGDVRVDRLAADGTATALHTAITEGLDAGGTTLVAGLAPGALTAGRYRLVLSSSNALVGADGSQLPAAPDRVLSEFTVGVPVAAGVRLAGAIDLNTPGSTPSATGGILDLAANPGDATLYRVTLPAGQDWRLGAEVTGGDFGKTLALFDASGRPIATAQYGGSGAPESPFLFEGLSAGTYYLGVSGGGNVPGLPGGYDPVTGAVGTAARASQGGAFQLVVVADALTGPTTLLQFHLDHADPTAPAPTGFSLQFSGALGFARDAGAGPTVDLGGGLSLVDSAGTSWPVQATSYDEGTARVTLLFGEALPAGQYTVSLAVQGGLTDLAGRPPVAPGQPSGILATFDVATASSPADPLDFGPLYPRAAEAGITRAADVAAGSTASFRFVVTSPGLYVIQTATDGGPVAISGRGTAGALAVGSQPTTIVNLAAGVYTLDASATGTQAARVAVTLKSTAGSTGNELLIQNGVGQGPALDLRLISPTLTPGGPAAGPTAYRAPADRAASPTAGPSGGAAGTNTPGVPAAVAAGLFLTPGSVAVGQPSAGSAHVEAADPGGPGDAPALASGGVGLLPGINYGLTPSGRPAPGRAPTKAVIHDGDAFATDGAIVAANLPEATPRGESPDPEPADWADRIRSAVASWVAPTIPDDLAADVVEALAQDETRKAGQGPGDQEVEQAGFGSPIGVGLAAILTAHFGRNLRGRSRKGRLPAGSASRSAGAKAKATGPHRPHRRA